ncbi:hypothetical protein [Streptomyces viridochromogenes]|uniref:hypothetical protein n=1 Tax=Streptomyces viridochromogenes TaxID=1938 RepID=UPI001F2CFC59|nr:hypothetical protein [Streptomyces viridochromogenes]
MTAVLAETVFPHLDRPTADLALPVSLGFRALDLAPFRLGQIVHGDLAVDAAVESENASLGRNGQTAALAGIGFRAHLRLVEIPAQLTAPRLAPRLAAGYVERVSTALALESDRYRS